MSGLALEPRLSLLLSLATCIRLIAVVKGAVGPAGRVLVGPLILMLTVLVLAALLGLAGLISGTGVLLVTVTVVVGVAWAAGLV